MKKTLLVGLLISFSSICFSQNEDGNRVIYQPSKNKSFSLQIYGGAKYGILNFSDVDQIYMNWDLTSSSGIYPYAGARVSFRPFSASSMHVNFGLGFVTSSIESVNTIQNVTIINDYSLEVKRTSLQIPLGLSAVLSTFENEGNLFFDLRGVLEPVLSKSAPFILNQSRVDLGISDQQEFGELNQASFRGGLEVGFTYLKPINEREMGISVSYINYFRKTGIIANSSESGIGLSFIYVVSK